MVSQFVASKAAKLTVVEERLHRALRRRGVVNKRGEVRPAVEKLVSVIRLQLELLKYAADPYRGGQDLRDRYRPEE